MRRRDSGCAEAAGRSGGAAQTTGGGATDCDAERARWAAPNKLPTGTNCEA